MIVNIALKIKKPFYKLIALGLGTEYAFQVFLTIGGATKFIPMTGVTLPLVSYGGSSVACTVLMLAIIQGLYILREDEDEEIERYRRKGTAQRFEEAPEAQSPRFLKREGPVTESIHWYPAFVLIFVSMIGYLIHFNYAKSDDFINSPYNTRQDTFSDRVVRGKDHICRWAGACPDQCLRRRNRGTYLSLCKYVRSCSRI